ncbi:hypothetical protein XENOCAPTIV_022131 [Xenoophorus captivus]|uniref:Uncharacterized protein n=1 Tax=Xenoophorus captivus TaxID=1517983 RepID=A0ABV0QE16_9TELE
MQLLRFNVFPHLQSAFWRAWHKCEFRTGYKVTHPDIIPLPKTAIYILVRMQRQRCRETAKGCGGVLIQEHMTEAGVTAHDAAWIKGRQTESDRLEARGWGGDFLSFCAAVNP